MSPLFPPLQLPSFKGKIRENKGKVLIFDSFRRKFVVLTPEEWVRQHFLHYLVSAYEYPPALMSVETGLQYHGLAKRSDILVLDRSGAPFVLIECKAPQIRLNEAVLAQALSYNAIYQAPHVVLTNGHQWPCWALSSESGPLLLPDLPSYPN
jgi:hypothetical protein